jgi:hypothetical protein
MRKDSKWYWWLPIIWIYYIPTMSRWALSAETKLERQWRMVLTLYLMFPSILIIIYIISITQ